jgi:hypothetical protein
VVIVVTMMDAKKKQHDNSTILSEKGVDLIP